VGSGFRLFFYLLGGESRFSPCNRDAKWPGGAPSCALLF